MCIHGFFFSLSISIKNTNLKALFLCGSPQTIILYFEGEGRQKIAVWRVVEPDDCWTDEELAAAADAAHEEYLRTGISYSFDEVKAKLRKMLDE